MRERLISPIRYALPSRITPAYAGKTTYPGHQALPLLDHPRVCGKDRKINDYFVPLHGSPPAYAGKTKRKGFIKHDKEDHPRVCGKDHLPWLIMGLSTGSPPRMRERLFLPFLILPFVRITPAYAGKTSQQYDANLNARDHPRVCGKDGTNS